MRLASMPRMLHNSRLSLELIIACDDHNRLSLSIRVEDIHCFSS